MAKETDILTRFGLRIRKLRRARGLSQDAFAAKCRMDRTYISGIERGKRNVSLRNIEVIAKSFGISLSHLMKNM